MLNRTALLIFLASATQAHGAESPLQLIRFLTYETDRPEGHLRTAGIGGCWESHRQEDMRIAHRLIALGQEARQALEDAIKDLEEKGRQSPVSRNPLPILFAYASIVRASGAERLLRMAGAPELSSMRVDIDAGLAVSFDQTSFVSFDRPALRVMCSGFDPRKAIDRLILGVSQGDVPAQVELLSSVTQEPLRRLLDSEISGSRLGWLYRLNRGGRMAFPADPYGPAIEDRKELLDTDFELEFLTLGEAVCGRIVFSFEQQPEETHVRIRLQDPRVFVGIVDRCAISRR